LIMWLILIKGVSVGGDFDMTKHAI